MYTEEDIKDQIDYLKDIQLKSAAAMLEELFNERRWIPVTEQLPEIDHTGFSEVVLVSIVGGSMFTAWRDIESKEYQQWESDNSLPEDPTHWMPIQPPQDK